MKEKLSKEEFEVLSFINDKIKKEGLVWLKEMNEFFSTKKEEFIDFDVWKNLFEKGLIDSLEHVTSEFPYNERLEITLEKEGIGLLEDSKYAKTKGNKTQIIKKEKDEE